MELLIDTSSRDKFFAALAAKKEIKDKMTASSDKVRKRGALFYINKLLVKNKIKISDIKRIRVADTGESFTALRSGLAIANALGFALGVEVKPLFGKAKPKVFRQNKKKIYLVKAKYNKEPNINYKRTAL